MEEVILENQNLIYSIANMYKGHANMEDLFQAGCIGIIKAYQNYKEDKGCKFSTYAYTYILGEISKCAREDNPIKISKDITSLYNRIEKDKTYLEQEMLKTPNEFEILSYDNIPFDKYVEAVNSYGCVDYLDDAINDTSMHELIGRSMDLDSIIELKDMLKDLSPIEKKIILGQYLYDLKQNEMASILGMNQVAVSRVKTKALTKLREQFH